MYIILDYESTSTFHFLHSDDLKSYDAMSNWHFSICQIHKSKVKPPPPFLPC